MEEAKAAAYYDELTRKGGGAAKFKQGLGFESSSSSSKPNVSSSPSSFYANFVRASGKSSKQTQLDLIQNKLSKKPPSVDVKDARGISSGDHGGHHRRDHRSRSRERGRSSTEDGRSDEDERRRRRSGPDREHGRHQGDRRSRSPQRSPRSRSRRDRVRDSSRSKHVDTDYACLIDGYSQMTPAEKVKAKMKLQLSQTAERDITKGDNKRWERFDFNKDAPLDDVDEEIEVAEDDLSLVKNVGKSFWFAAVEAKREDEIRVAHDHAMFGAPTVLPHAPLTVHSEEVSAEQNETKEDANNTLINDKIFAMQQGSWRERVRKS